MNLNKKTIALKKFFSENYIDMFESENLNDEAETTIFRSRMQIKGQLLPFAILVDRTIYILIQVQLAPAVATGDAFTKIAKYLNECNNKYRLFKFTISEAGDLLINATLIFKDENFEPALLNAILAEVVKFLDGEYIKLASEIGFYAGNISEESLKHEKNNDNFGHDLTHYAGHLAIKLLKDFLFGKE